MTLREALRFCNEVEKAATKKKKLTLFDFVAIYEKFNRGFDNKSQKTEQVQQQVKHQNDTVSNVQLLPLKTISFAGGKMIPPDKGEALINENREVFCDYLQDTIKIDRLFTDHIKGKGKTRNDRRYGRAKFLLHTLRHPQEVWINDSNGRYKGRLTFISQFRDNTTGRVMSVYVVAARNKKTLTADFFMNDPDDINAKRNGRLLPPKKQGNE